jgi:hypothetical protein
MVALLAIIVLSNQLIGIKNMSSLRAFIKTRRDGDIITSEAYQYGGANHGDAIGVQWSISAHTSRLTVRVCRDNLMIKLCGMGIIPVTQLEGLVLCFPDGNGGIEKIADCA